MKTDKRSVILSELTLKVRKQIAPIVDLYMSGKIQTYEQLHLTVTANVVGEFMVTGEVVQTPEESKALRKKIYELEKQHRLEQSSFNQQIAKLEKIAKQPPEYTEKLVDTLTNQLRESSRQLRDAKNELKRVYEIIHKSGEIEPRVSHTARNGASAYDKA